MNRREAIAATAKLLGGSIIGAQLFLEGCVQKKESASFAPDDLELLNEIGETIIPQTPDSPGAKAAKISEFIQTMVTDCYSAEEQATFFSGLQLVREKAEQKFDKDFMSLAPEQKHALLVDIDKEASQGEKPHYFQMMKQLTVLGYFSSQPGATEALRYVPIPGRYDGCIPYLQGQKAWA
ncbi:MAG TPA: gluconate 2-dehydrogenase subunit 3 family protein [Cyclobacteriaceae bacterium]|nr:gluconate 2-dehydrogenase subunit 3 family protein [Cyclobacteriaceae bacterium]